jgi:hypothetical protein
MTVKQELKAVEPRNINTLAADILKEFSRNG